MARPATLPAAHHVLMRRLRRSYERRLRTQLGGSLESRADPSGEVPPTSPLGVPPVSRTDGSGEALTVSQLGVRKETRAAGFARRGLASRRMLIPENSRGCGLSLFLLPHFAGARTVIVQDGYVRTQLERLRELAEMARGSGVRRIEVVVKPWRPGEIADVAADAASSDPLLSLVESVGGIEWSVRTSTLHHDRQIKILRDDGGVTVDLGRGLGVYYAAQNRYEDQTNSDTLRARETVVWTRAWQSRDAAPGQSSKCRGTTAAAQDLSTRSTRKLRRLAQRLRELERSQFAGKRLDAQQRSALHRRKAVELALSWRRRPGPRSETSIGEAWTCPVPWCRAANRPERLTCVYEPRGCPGLRDRARFDSLCEAARRLQHFWRCKLYRLRRSWQAIARAEAAAEAKWRRGPVALEDRTVQTEGPAGGLVITHDAWTQANSGPRPSADSPGFSQEYGPLRKRAKAAIADTAETIAAQNAWMAGAAGSAPTADEIDFVFRSFPALDRGPPRTRPLARRPSAPSMPLPMAETEKCLWCRAPLEAGQQHICGVVVTATPRASAASSPRARRVARPRAPLDAPARPTAPALCGWCRAPLVAGEIHVCGDAAEAQHRDRDESASDESL